ncbi:MAG TPA: hypothetical protein VLW53_21750, partial [Candidatus Eisenbacteria bacterium]|nr:hypothetical protein [Candidatus Eisenbacteria bacterium]
MTQLWSTDEPLTALLIDDGEAQARRIRDALRPHGIGVEWRSSYRTAMEVLRDPDAGRLVDLVLIDQAFDEDTVAPDELLTEVDVDPRPGTDEWDVQQQQGLFILARLDQDMREGVIPFTPMMILTHHGRLDLAARIGRLELGGYASKQALLSDPYTTLLSQVPGIRPTDVDIDRKLGDLTADVKIEAHLVRQIRDSIRRGLDPDTTCSALRGLPDPNDWRVVGLMLEELDQARSSYSSEELARALAQAWYPSPDGWLRVQELVLLGAVDERFHAFRMEMGRPGGSTFGALAAATALPAAEAPCSGVLRERFRLLRTIDSSSCPVRISAGRWTVLGCWLPEPPVASGGLPQRGLQSAARRVGELHRLGLAHGSLTSLTTAFESPVFGGIRCLLGVDPSDLRADDLARLAALAVDGDAGRMAARAEADPAAAGASVFRDRLLASLGPDDVVLSEVECGEISPVPLDLVVCTAGAIAVLEHRGERRLDRCEGALERWRRCTDALASVAEGRLGLVPGKVSRLTALVVADGAEVDGPAGGWSSMATESAVIAALTRTSAAGHPPAGAQIAGALPPQPRVASSRALHWRTTCAGDGTTRLRTRRRQWSPERWRELASGLVAARDALAELPAERRPFELIELRAYDGAGERCTVENPTVELLEYDASVPGGAVPLTGRVPDARSHAVRRRLAASVLRQVGRWECSGLAYRTMEPDGLVCADGSVHCDLLQSIVRADPRHLRRQRRGAAACLVLLLSPWPHLWPA